MMPTFTASEVRANLNRLMDQAAESHQPIHIAGKRTSAVLLSTEDWQAIQETLFLLSVPNMRESIKESMAAPLSENVKELDWCAGKLSFQNMRKKTQRNWRLPG